MITSYNYEGKIKEEVLKNCLNELNVSENDCRSGRIGSR